MATVKDLLQEELVIEELKAIDKRGVIREFSRLLKATGRIEKEDELMRVLLEREALGSTGIGDGVAIPHAKLPFLPEMIIAFGRSSRGVDFQSRDARPVHLFFLLVTPEDRPGEYLKALSRISRILKNPALREKLRQASHRQELQRLIFEEDNKYPQPRAVQHP
jgi:PTS system nitrogen regulatory IIA component